MLCRRHPGRAARGRGGGRRRRGGEHRVPRGDRDAPEGRAGREFRAAAGDSLRAGRGCGRGGFPCLPRASLAFFSALARAARSRLAALRALFCAFSPWPWPCGPRRGAVPAAAPGRGSRTRRPARLSTRTAGHQPGHGPRRPGTRRTVFSDGATSTPARLLSGQPSALSTRCGRLAAHSPTAVNESHPASRAAIATAITHARAEPHAPPVPRIRQPRQPVPQRCGRAGIR